MTRAGDQFGIAPKRRGNGGFLTYGERPFAEIHPNGLRLARELLSGYLAAPARDVHIGLDAEGNRHLVRPDPWRSRTLPNDVWPGDSRHVYQVCDSAGVVAIVRDEATQRAIVDAHNGYQSLAEAIEGGDDAD